MRDPVAAAAGLRTRSIKEQPAELLAFELHQLALYEMRGAGTGLVAAAADVEPCPKTGIAAAPSSIAPMSHPRFLLEIFMRRI